MLAKWPMLRPDALCIQLRSAGPQPFRRGPPRHPHGRHRNIGAPLSPETRQDPTGRLEMTSNFKTALTAGFQTLRARGYFAEQNWQCCQSCGVAAIPDEYTDYV